MICLYLERGLVKTNYRGNPVSPSLGPALLLGYLFAAAAAVWLDHTAGQLWLLSIPVALGVSLYGLWDDMMEDGTSGFRGHFGRGLQGKMTAGLLKVITAVPVAVIFSGSLPLPLPQRILAMVLVILSANGLNLLDRRPGRAVKVFFITAAVIILTASQPGPAVTILLPLMAVTLVVAPLDLNANGMLGDCGSNLLGALLGVAAVFALAPASQMVLLVFWSVIHLISEYVSLSRIIENNFLLRYLDNLGLPRKNLP